MILNMDRISIEAARPKLGEIVDRVRFTDEPVIVTRQGKTAAFVVSPDWYRAAAHALGEQGIRKERGL
jgi:prevent-host-death family protein